MGSIPEQEPPTSPSNHSLVDDPSDSPPAVAGLGNQALLDKIDRLRELNVGSLVSLPQLVVVGDQSSGKSSVLESLTSFSFPRASGLCTRYATQITCRRESQIGVTVSIIPRPGADDALKTRLRAFRRTMDTLDGHELTQIFEEANVAMGIRAQSDSSPRNDGRNLATFSEDILKIEIKGPDQPGLTVIDVPGIFRTATPGVTSDSDMSLVTNMVKSYMKDSRTMILAVIPCNVDIATQEILKLAKEADPQGLRTMGVLTKPDLVPERSMQKHIVDLIRGRRQDLKLGYCVVKNRGADDEGSSLAERESEERAYFTREPWLGLASLNRVGTKALRARLIELQMAIARREFPKVKADIAGMLTDSRKSLEDLGDARNDERSQRAYLGRLASRFESIVRDALNAYYNDDPIFNDQQEMRLVTRIVELNEVFANDFANKGHTRHFEHAETTATGQTAFPDEPGTLSFEIPDWMADLDNIIIDEPFTCSPPSDDPIMDHIADVFRDNRGPELGTFGSALPKTIFKEQSKRWPKMVLSHTSDAILIVHQFILDLLHDVIGDSHVRDELYDHLLEKLQASYKRAMDHARFLVEIEREGTLATYNPSFGAELQRVQMSRRETAFGELANISPSSNTRSGAGGSTTTSFGIPLSNQAVHIDVLRAGLASTDRSSPQQVREYLHDVVQSYYQISMKRIVDVVCQQAVYHFLLSGKDSPLRVFSTEMVFSLGAGTLEMIAGEDQVTKSERERLASEIGNLQEAMHVLRC